MRPIETINKELESLKFDLENLQGTSTEVYTRIVGYYRSVRNWNKGKREEYSLRVCFSNPEGAENHSFTSREELEVTEGVSTSPVETTIQATGAASYLYFYRASCPNCPPVQRYLDELEMAGRKIDSGNDEGLKEALERSVMSTPTVIFIDGEGNEIARGRNVSELSKMAEGVESTLAAASV